MKNLKIKIGAKPRSDKQVVAYERADEYSSPASKVGKPKRKFPWKKFLLLLIVLGIIGGVVFFYLRLDALNTRVERLDEDGNKVEQCTNILNPACWTDAFKPQLKETNGRTNVLIVGLDTRTDGGSLLNTDSLIVISYDHATKKTMMVSVPRDLYSTKYQAKINAIYAFTKARAIKEGKDQYFYLEDEISNIIGTPVHYLVTVHFDGVTSLVDQLGGVQVCPEKAFTARYPNPLALPGKRNVEQWIDRDYKAGCQDIDGFGALVYARFRHLARGPVELASDFSRGRRQQEVINGIKDKLLSQDMSVSQRAETYWSLLQNLSQNITLQGFSFEDMLAALSYLDTADKKPVSIVLDPNFGGKNKFLRESCSTPQLYKLCANDSTYKKIQAELTQIFNFADFYKEEPVIVVSNLSGAKSLAADNPAMKLKTDTHYYKSFEVVNGAKATTFAGIHVFDFTGGTKSGSLNTILKQLGISSAENSLNYGINQSNKKEDFLIVIGPDKLDPTATPTSTPSN